ncbi:UBP-type zinc finger domain-containing protein [Nocardia sp. NPDC059177]|uniref:UBP-type zinc finger domain-containing protein n=1 Tax=Nocardia sp. NPDC059177 TaxID=3346759 RepID=UPI0036878237
MSEDGIDVSAAPSGPGCAECSAAGGWWVHLRRCAKCGHVGCCDSSPSRHASKHFASTGHPFIQSYEPGEDWFWNFTTSEVYSGGPELAAPTSHPIGQSVPGPADRVPANWQSLIN